MRSLIAEIDKINLGLIVGINDTSKGFGLCKQVRRGEEIQNLEITSGKQVVLDDKYSRFFYHKISGVETYNEIKAPGKTKLYNAIINIDLIGFSEFNNFDDHLKNRLSQFKHIKINSTDHDMYKIIANETGKKDFDFKKYLFVVNYQLLYKTDNCDETCL